MVNIVLRDLNIFTALTCHPSPSDRATNTDTKRREQIQQMKQLSQMELELGTMPKAMFLFPDNFTSNYSNKAFLFICVGKVLSPVSESITADLEFCSLDFNFFHMQ